MNNAKVLPITALALLVLVLGYMLSTIEWTMVEEEVGLSSEANAKPLLAANLFLETYNKSLTSITTQSTFLKQGKIVLPEGSSLLIDEGALAEYEQITPALITWINNGGHLIYTLSPQREQLDLANNAIIELTEIAVVDSDTPAYRKSVLEEPEPNGIISEKEHTFSVYLAHKYNFENCKGLEVLNIENDEILICEESIGNGYITFVPSLNAISNHGLKHLDHGEYLLWLIGSNNKLFYLPSTQSTHWAVLLWQWCWQVVLLTAVVCILLMWQLSMRLGLPIEQSGSSKNLFIKHIEAVGNFLFKNEHHDVLKNALLIDLANAVEKRHPQYKQLNLDEQASLISSLTGKKTHDVYILLSEPLPADENNRIRFIKLFKELRNLL